jgi:hypothetical protein
LQTLAASFEEELNTRIDAQKKLVAKIADLNKNKDGHEKLLITINSQIASIKAEIEVSV